MGEADRLTPSLDMGAPGAMDDKEGRIVCCRGCVPQRAWRLTTEADTPLNNVLESRLAAVEAMSLLVIQ